MTAQTTAESRRDEFTRYQRDPVGFIEGELRCVLTEKQREIAASVRDYPATVVQSANAVGKTHVAGAIAAWVFRCFPGSKIVTTAAPPLENLKLLLWGEIGARLRAAETAFSGAHLGVLHASFSDEWWLTGRAIPQGGAPSEREAKFSGVHAPYLLFIVDEGDAVPDEVYRGIESCMSGGWARLLVLFNPRAAIGPVYQLIRNHQANVIELDAFSHPNVATGKNVIPGAVTRETTVARVAKWSAPIPLCPPAEQGEVGIRERGEVFQVPGFLDGATATREDGTVTTPLVGGEWRRVENPALSYMVLARFPGQAENQLIARAWVETAQARWMAWQAMHGSAPPDVAPVLGQDVAEYGSDRNVSCLRYGGWVTFAEPWGGVDVLISGDRAASLARDHRARTVFVDATGVGAGVGPQVRRWMGVNGGGHEFRVVEVKVAESPTVRAEEGAFGILRDQIAWLCREWLRSDPGAMLPPNEALADELCAFTYRVQRGVIRVSDKETLRARLRRSPDLADALFLTFTPETTAEVFFL